MNNNEYFHRHYFNYFLTIKFGQWWDQGSEWTRLFVNRKSSKKNHRGRCHGYRREMRKNRHNLVEQEQKMRKKIYLRLLRGEEDSKNTRQLYTEICKWKSLLNPIKKHTKHSPFIAQYRPSIITLKQKCKSRLHLYILAAKRARLQKSNE